MFQRWRGGEFQLPKDAISPKYVQLCIFVYFVFNTNKWSLLGEWLLFSSSVIGALCLKLSVEVVHSDRCSLQLWLFSSLQ